MTKSLPAKTLYNDLIKTVKAALTAGLIEAQKALEYQRVKTYWTIGAAVLDAADRPVSTILNNKELYTKISADVERSLGLELSTDTIQRCVQFRKTFPVFPKDTPLTFTHYLALSRVTDERERRKLERAAIKAELTTPDLKKKVAQLNSADAALLPSKTAALPVERGEPYIYFLRKISGLKGEEGLCVGCGFRIHIPLNGALGVKSAKKFSVKSSRYVCSVKVEEGYQLRLAVRKRVSVYTYAARVIKVVDGDTLDALIDVGFGIRARQRFRLKFINAPETGSAAGERARAFLTKYLSRCPIIVVRTQKAGMYGRWLGDIFALPGSADPAKIAAEGEYLIQVMLDKGRAVKYG